MLSYFFLGFTVSTFLHSIGLPSWMIYGISLPLLFPSVRNSITDSIRSKAVNEIRVHWPIVESLIAEKIKETSSTVASEVQTRVSDRASGLSRIIEELPRGAATAFDIWNRVTKNA